MKQLNGVLTFVKCLHTLNKIHSFNADLQQGICLGWKVKSYEKITKSELLFSGRSREQKSQSNL